MIVENNETFPSSNGKLEYNIYQITSESSDEEKQRLSDELRRLRNDIVGSPENKKTILGSSLFEKYNH